LHFFTITLNHLDIADPLEVGRIQREEGVNCLSEAVGWLRLNVQCIGGIFVFFFNKIALGGLK
jgi:hypothetical protein